MTKHRHLRKVLIALGLCAALLIAIAACGTPGSNGEATTHPPAEDTGIVLNLFQPHHGQASLWQALAADYKNLTGVTLNVHTPAMGSDALEELKDFFDRDDAPGLFLFNNPRHYHEWREHAHDLSGIAAYGRLVDDRFVLRYDDKAVGLPLGLEAFGIIYNEDILNAYFALSDRGTDFESITQINTYRELEALVRDLHEHREELDIDGVFAAPGLREGEHTAWSTRLLSIPVGYEIKSQNHDVIGNDMDDLHLRYEAGYRGFHELHWGHLTTREGLENRGYADAAREFTTGRAAMIMGSTDFYGYLSAVTGATVSIDDIAFMPAFMQIESVNRQGLSFEAVHYAAINGHADEEQIRASEQFLDWLVTSERGMTFLVNELNVIAPFDSVLGGTAQHNPLAENAIYWLQNENVTNAVTYSMIHPGDEFRDQVMGAGLRAYARGERAWDRFVEDTR